MSYHSRLLGKCVGANNQKYFLLFLFYSSKQLQSLFTVSPRSVDHELLVPAQRNGGVDVQDF